MSTKRDTTTGIVLNYHEGKRIARELPEPKGPYGPWFEIWSVGCNTGIRISAIDGQEAIRVFKNLVGDHS